MAQNGVFGISGSVHILVYYIIISNQRINFYRVEIIDMGRLH